MSRSSIEGFRIAGVATCLPARVENNLADDLGFDPDEVRKVVQMAGVRERRVVDAGITSADLCFEAAEQLLQRLGWERDSVSGLIFVTQSPDYFLPSTRLIQWRRMAWQGIDARENHRPGQCGIGNPAPKFAVDEVANTTRH